MKTGYLSAALLAALSCACSAPQTDTDGADRRAIFEQMRATWDRPQLPLDAGPVVIEGDYAIADWTQGRMGGRALLKRESGTWITLLCAGDGIRSAAGLQEAGLPIAPAQALAERLAAAERQVSAKRLASMSTFAGTVRMHSEGGAHGERR